MDKTIVVKLNGSRQVEGLLRGYDPFMNLVVDEASELKKNNKIYIGIVVCVIIIYSKILYL